MEKLVPICVRLPRELYNKLKVHCAEKGLKMKEVISDLIKSLKKD